ncbi:MAG: hypothetical protein IH591_10860, partial [Bacteroidales bacterium]|nr:hypothetical protein [Bacteroidales bacterium]
YSRSSINQYALGLLIFIGLLVNIENIFRLLPDVYGSSAAVIILVGLGNLVSVSAGINGVILSTSALYRYQTWLMFILIALFVTTSMIFIPLFGITGAALATMVSNIIYNMLGVIVVGTRFGLWPYSMAHLKMTFVGLAAASAGYLIPQINLIPDIIVRSLLVTFIFIAGVYFLRLSDDMNGLFGSFMTKMKKKL